MSLEASTATPHLDAEGQFSLALEPVERVEPVESVEMSVTNHSDNFSSCLLYTSPSPRDISGSRMPSSA